MKVKIRNTIYDGEKEPIMIVLSQAEKEQISNMSPGATKYCVYPDDDEWIKSNFKKIKEWMKT